MAERSCDGCQLELKDSIRVSCAECEDYDLCVDCFCQGFQSKDHKSSHTYRLLDRCSYPILSPDWGGDEELLLIEGLETYGIGNWEDVAGHVGTKTADECRDHYVNCFLDSAVYPLPEKRRLDSHEVEAAKKRRRLNPNRRNIHVLPPLKTKVAPSHPANHEIQGYMPGRMEFEHEAENDAELMVKDMVFNEDDGSTEKELKLAVLDVYNSRLDIRAERKKFIFSRNLIDFRKVQAVERKKSKEEKDFIQTIRPMARLMTVGDFESFTETIMAETRLRERIAQLQEYRRYGINTFRAADEYEVAKKQRLASMMLRSPFAVTSERVFKQLTSSNSLQQSAATPPSIGTSNQKTPSSSTKSLIDLTGVECCDYLTGAEQKLCIELQIHPRAYLSIKRMVLKTSISGQPTRSNARISSAKMTQIIKFLESSNLIN